MGYGVYENECMQDKGGNGLTNLQGCYKKYIFQRLQSFLVESVITTFWFLYCSFTIYEADGFKNLYLHIFAIYRVDLKVKII